MHTPGPWRDTGEYDRAYGYYDTVIECEDRTRFCVIVRGHSKESMIADARLIAAAPELLAACDEELEALRIWLRAAKLPEDLRQGIAISIDKLERVTKEARGQ